MRRARTQQSVNPSPRSESGVDSPSAPGRLRLGLVAALLLAVITTSCSGETLGLPLTSSSTELSDLHDALPGPQLDRHTAPSSSDAENRDTPVPSPAEWSGETSAFQDAILADGMVTFQEYEEAIYATSDCIASAGIDIEGPFLEANDVDHGVFHYHQGTRDKSRFYTWIVSSPTSEGLDAAIEVHDRCRVEYLEAVEWLYSHLNRRTVVEVEEYYRQLQMCLESNGVDVGDGSREAIDDAATASFATGCA